jgi:hypothetical protein
MLQLSWNRSSDCEIEKRGSAGITFFMLNNRRVIVHTPLRKAEPDDLYGIVRNLQTTDRRGAMHLSKHDLFQMNDEWLKKLPAELLLEVSNARRQGVAGSAESEPGQQLASADQPSALGKERRLGGPEWRGGRERHRRRRRRDGDGKLDGRHGTGSAGRWPAVIGWEGVWEAARQATGQSRPWPQSETGDHRPVRPPPRTLRRLCGSVVGECGVAGLHGLGRS